MPRHPGPLPRLQGSQGHVLFGCLKTLWILNESSRRAGRSVSLQGLSSGAGPAPSSTRMMELILQSLSALGHLKMEISSSPGQTTWILLPLWLHVAVAELSAAFGLCVSSCFGLGAQQALRTEATLFIPRFLSFYQVLFIFKHLFDLSCKMKTIASAAFYLSTGGVQADTHIKALGIFIIPDSLISSGV